MKEENERMIFMKEKVEKKRKEKVIRSRVTEEKYAEVQKYVEETGISISSLVSLAVSEYMKKNK